MIESSSKGWSQNIRVEDEMEMPSWNPDKNGIWSVINVEIHEMG